MKKQQFDILKNKKRNIQNLAVLGAAAATIVASGEDVNPPIGSDKLVVLGITSNGTYSAADLQDFLGTGVDISTNVDLGELNNNAQQTASSGDAFNGGADKKILYTFGEVDLAGITLSNISKLFLDDIVVISDAVLKASGLTEILGQGVIKAQTGLLDFDGIIVPEAIDIQDADGNIITPVADETGLGAEANVGENTTIVGIFTVTDESAVGNVTYALSGVDADLFMLDETTGALSFKTAPDFDTALDVGQNNIYDVTITATDEHLKSLSQDIAITVIDDGINAAPVFAQTSKAVPVDEMQTAVTTSLATDADGDSLTYSLEGVDADKFTVSAAGVVTFITAPDFEAPTDVGENNIYDIVLKATDTGGLSATQNVEVTVENVNEAPVFAQAILEVFAAENQTSALTSLATDPDDDAGLFYTLEAGDADKFSVSEGGVISFLTAPDFENETDEDQDGIYDFNLVATDKGGLSVTQNVLVEVIDENEAASGEVTIAGIAGIGQTLIATHNLADPDGIADLSTSWLRDGEVIQGANETIYILVQDDVGKKIVFQVVLKDGLGNDTVFASDETLPIGNNLEFWLGDINGSNGYQISGNIVGGRSGFSVSSAGDVNGDGYDDVIIGAPRAGDAGKSYVVFGKPTDSLSNVSLASLDGSNGFEINGQASNDESGISVSGAGDVNGDGFDDLLIGATHQEDLASGGGYIVYGKASFDDTLNLSALSAADGHNFPGSGGQLQQAAVSNVGDVNGDGYDDFILGGYDFPIGDNESRFAHIVFGKQGGIDPTTSLKNLDGTDGFKFITMSGSNSTRPISVSSAGDVNGDGFDDIIIGDQESFGGKSYVVFGKADGFDSQMQYSDIDGQTGFGILGINSTDHAGHSVSSAGDFNNDGYDDLIVGAWGVNSFQGAAYIIFGTAEQFDDTINLADIDEEVGIRISGGATTIQLGYSVSSAGDFNGDGYDDVIVGSLGGDNSYGYNYLVFGGASGNIADIDLSTLNSNTGIVFREAGINSGIGQSISGAGDVNGDGYDDLIFGTPFSFTLDGPTGSSYIVYGGGDFAANDDVASADDDALIGTIAADTMAGLAGDDILRAGLGDDTLIGGAGADRMYGGGGADHFIFAAGDSTISFDNDGFTIKTIGFDIIEDFKVGDGTHNSETLEIVGDQTIVADSGLDGVDSDFKVDGQRIKSSVVENGVMRFSDNDVSANGEEMFITNEDYIVALVEYLQANDFGDQGATFAIDVGADAFIFSQGSDNGADDGADILIRLEDVQIDALTAVMSNGEFDLFLA